MSVSLAVTVIVLADLALLGALAYAMSRAAKLRPHAPATQLVARRAPVARSRARRATARHDRVPVAG